MIDARLLQHVTDQDTLVTLLHTAENSGGLGWPVDLEAPFEPQTQIAEGVKGSRVRVSRLVPASADERYLILLAEFEQEYARRDLRALLASVRRTIRETGRFEDHGDIGDIVFIVAQPGYSDVRFVLFEKQERRLARIRSFGWSRDHIGRTLLTHNLDRLKWSRQLLWDAAWNVEALTEEFYNEFVRVFDAVVAKTEHPDGEAMKRAYVQQLLNRLLFISFIEKMGWLKTPEGETDYLHGLWQRHRKERDPAALYRCLAPKCDVPHTFNALLGKLFFDALNRPEGIMPGHPLYNLLGEVPRS